MGWVFIYVCVYIYYFFNHHLRTCFLREREEGRGRERERNIDVREKHWSVASCVPWPLRPLTPIMVVFVDGVSNEVINVKQGYKGGLWTNRINVFIRSGTRQLLSLSLSHCPLHPQPHVRTQREGNQLQTKKRSLFRT